MRAVTVVRLGTFEWSTDEDLADGGIIAGSVSLVKQADGQRAANTVQVTLDDPRSELANRLPLPKKQANKELPPVMVWFGYKPKLELVFVGQMSGLEARMLPGEVTFSATDKARGARKTARARAIGSASVAQLVRQLAKESGLTPQIKHPEKLEQIRFSELIQHNESNDELISRMLGNIGWQSHLRDSVLIIEPNELDLSAPIIEIVLGRDVADQPSFRVEEFTRARTPNVYDGGGASIFEDGVADPEIVERLVMLDQTGVLLTSEDFPAYSSQTVERAMRAQAKAKDVFKGTMRLEANPRIDVNTNLLLRGFGARWSGVWRVSQVSHDLVNSTTEVEIFNGGAP